MAFLIILVSLYRDYFARCLESLIELHLRQNFACTIFESEFFNLLYHEDGSQTSTADLFDTVNNIFTVIFTVELAINALAHWFRPFVTDVWSQLDAFVVAMSILPLLVPQQNTGIVRILRAFRIVRLFRRVPSLRKIITALTMALLPVLNVFLILFLLMGICE
jgi:hypothetical protein